MPSGKGPKRAVASRAATSIRRQVAPSQPEAARQPAPEPRPPANGSRFVVRLVDARRQHFDLCLEIDGEFVSWTVVDGPSRNPRQRRLAVRAENHPLEVATYEGLKDGDSGRATAVLIWDHGTWSTADGQTPAEALRTGNMLVQLEGRRLQGSWVLRRLKADGRRQGWILVKQRDAFADAADDAAPRAPRSVISGLTIEDIERKRRRP